MDKDDLIKRFHKSLNAHLTNKIDETIKKSIATTSNEMLSALSNLVNPFVLNTYKDEPKSSGVKPDIVILDEMAAFWQNIVEDWKPIGSVAKGITFKEPGEYWIKLYSDTNPFLESIQKMALAIPTQKVFFGIKDANGKEVKIPVDGFPEFTGNYTLADEDPEVKLSNVMLEVQTVYVEHEDGSGESVYMGPFVIKDSSPPLYKVPESITLEHNGQYFILKPGDTFTVNYHVDGIGVPGFKPFDHDEVVKILEFNYKTTNPQPYPPKPSPFLLNEEGEKSAKLAMSAKSHQNNGTWTFDWFKKLECFIIGGHFGNKRYEVILGQVVPVGEWENTFGIPYSDLPSGLRTLIQQCNKALVQHISEKRAVFKHPKLHEIQVRCPGFGEEVGEVWGGTRDICYHPKASLYDMIQHVNDAHQWTREAIAEWIDTLDEQPVFYPVIESQRVANSAKVVTLEPPFQKGTSRR